MKFECPHCRQRLSAEPDQAGQQIGCPACLQNIAVPPPEAAPESLLRPVVETPAPVLAAVPDLPSMANGPKHMPTPERRPKSKRPLLFALGATGLLLMAVAAVLFLRGPIGHRAKILSHWTGPAPVELHVYPTNVNLTTQGDRQSLVVQAIYANGLTRDVTDEARFMLGNPTLAKIDQGILSPLADGKTDLQIKYGGKVLSLPVSVEQARTERPISFTLDVMPVFMKAGCNSGS